MILRTRTRRVLGIGAVAVVAVAMVLWWLLFSGDEPADLVASDIAAPPATDQGVVTEPSEADATDTVEMSPVTGGDAESSEAAAGSAVSESPGPAAVTIVAEAVGGSGLAGEGNVDDSNDSSAPIAGEGNVDDPSDPNALIAGTWNVVRNDRSFVGFRVEEDLVIGEGTLVGRTHDMSGFIQIGGGAIEAVQIEANMSAVKTHRPMRDTLLHRALDTDQFPTATFVLTRPVVLPAGTANGAAVSAEAVGDLTVRGFTNPVVVAIDAQFVDDVLVMVGTVGVRWEDYGVQVPSVPMVSVEGQGTVELQVLLTR